MFWRWEVATIKMDMNMPVNVPVDDPNADTEW